MEDSLKLEDDKIIEGFEFLEFYEKEIVRKDKIITKLKNKIEILSKSEFVTIFMFMFIINECEQLLETSGKRDENLLKVRDDLKLCQKEHERLKLEMKLKESKIVEQQQKLKTRKRWMKEIKENMDVIIENANTHSDNTIVAQLKTEFEEMKKLKDGEIRHLTNRLEKSNDIRLLKDIDW